MQIRLVDSHMAQLVEEKDIPRDVRRRLLKGGLFAVGDKPLFDRLIFDRRPMNFQEQTTWLGTTPSWAPSYVGSY